MIHWQQLPQIFIFFLAILFPAGRIAVSAKGGIERYQLKIVVDVPWTPKESKKFHLWIPYPQEGPHQKILRSEIKSSFPWRLEKEKQFGNRMLFVNADSVSSPFKVEMDFEIERQASRGISLDDVKRDPTLNPALYQEITPSVPHSNEIAKIAEQEAGNLKTEYQKINALYQYIYETMTYNKDGEGWGRGDPIWACANRRGNCTDFHSLFIALAQSQKIPARFEIGIPIPPQKESGRLTNYHCWAQAFDPKRGWIPLDASESKKINKPNAFFNYLPPDRILISAGRDLILNPPQKGKSINFFFHPYAEADGQQWDAVQATFYFKRL